jgi:hypothetical protein
VSQPGSPVPARSTLARDAALLLGVPLVLLVVLLAWWRPWVMDRYDVPQGRSIFSVVAGTWDWESAEDFCTGNPHTISFSGDSGVMIITPEEPWEGAAGELDSLAVYDLQEASSSYIRGQLRGETRLTKDGRPVVWDLVLTSNDTYRWRQTEWSSFLGYTDQVRRCPALLPSLFKAPGDSIPP